MTAAALAAQQPAAPTPATTTALSVFLDCQNVSCDFDYIRTEIKAINWVRDREVSDVHVLVTGEDTGAGGRDFTFTFIGLRGFAGVTDTLHMILPPTFTDDERRTGTAKALRVGLVRYVARTPGRDKVTISLGEAVGGSGQTTTKADPWKAWVFRVGTDGYTFGEETYLYYSVSGRFSANRITEKWKTQMSTRTNYSQDEFEIDDSTRAVNIRRNYSASLLQVKSLSAHWSAGLRGQFSSSTYENTTRHVRMTPAVEYNVYPYAQSTRKQFKFEYAVGLADYVYKDTTIYDKKKETLPMHRLSVYVSQKQPWGQVDMRLNGTQYLHDGNGSKYRVGMGGYTEIRVFKGFNVFLDGGYDIIYDQLSLAKKDYTPQEILLRQFQRGSTYSYYFSAGMSYTFGSIFNNVVNPRFD